MVALFESINPDFEELSRILFASWYNACKTSGNTRVTKADQERLQKSIAEGMQLAYFTARQVTTKQKKSFWRRLLG